MAATWETAFDRIATAWPKGFMATTEIRTADVEIAHVRAQVLLGRASLSDFRQAVEAWERLIEQEWRRCSSLANESHQGGKH
jgi:hypothetical protein